ncbi:MAG TPA: FkbM family methyltransferase [Syntrophales bacterium]|nr:FkbM family methyltransferase [Syntrophales bacterium]
MNPLRSLSKAFGYELIKEKKNPSLSSHLNNIFNLYRIDHVLDVGANHGQFAKMIRKSGYRGAIYSFEPVTASFERLTEVARGDDHWHTFKFGLGDERASMAINLSKSSDLNSLLTPSEYGKSRYPKIEINDQEIIEIDTLDHFLVESGIPFDARIFLKMDTQGYDLRVFDGAKNSLGRFSGLLSELSLIPIYDNAPCYLESLACYERSGFQVSGLYPVSRNPNLTIIEVDCVLVNKNPR